MAQSYLLRARRGIQAPDSPKTGRDQANGVRRREGSVIRKEHAPLLHGVSAPSLDGAEITVTTQSQNRLVLNHLKKVGPITPLQALRRYGILRLGARIHDLRESGHFILTTPTRVRGRKDEKAKIVARYSLVKAAKEVA